MINSEFQKLNKKIRPLQEPDFIFYFNQKSFAFSSSFLLTSVARLQTISQSPFRQSGVWHLHIYQ